MRGKEQIVEAAIAGFPLWEKRPDRRKQYGRALVQKAC